MDKIDIVNLSDDDRRSIAVRAHEGATHFCLITRRFITDNDGVYTTMMNGNIVIFNYPCELVKIGEVFGDIVVESFKHGDVCVCHDSKDGRNCGVAVYVSKSLQSGYSLVKFSSTYSGNQYADVKDISLSRIK